MNEAPQVLRPVFLHPGELYVGQEASCVSTVLGSCVAVTMYSREHGLAAICHGMLPDPGFNERDGRELAQPFRYLSLAIPKMLEEFRLRGIAVDEIEAKIFGGADVMRMVQGERQSIGASNIDRARQLLSEAKLPISRFHVGGNAGRKLRFNTDTGAVFLAHLTPRILL